LVNTVLSAGLFFVMRLTGIGEMAFAGIAFGTILASWLNIAMLSGTLHKRGHLVLDARLRARLPRILISSLVMGFAVWGTSELIHALFAAGPIRTPDVGYTRRAAQLFHARHTVSLVAQAASLVALVLVGLVVFAGAALLTRATSLSEFGSILRRQ